MNVNQALGIRINIFVYSMSIASTHDFFLAHFKLHYDVLPRRPLYKTRKKGSLFHVIPPN